MKTLLLNLPNRNQVIRRYMCSYNAPHFLFPPLELMYLGGVVMEWKKGDVRLLDAVAERMGEEETLAAARVFDPDLVVFLTGFEIFGEDMAFAARLKRGLPRAMLVGMGYYPTLFPEEILRKSPVDALLLGEPELAFSALYGRIERRESLDGIRGVAFRRGGEVVSGGEAERIADLDALPFPARSLIKERLYGEAMMPRPFTVLQTSRGCPFACTYCVRTFGRKLVFRSVENILRELEEIRRRGGLRSVRFMDDTFNVKPGRIAELCTYIRDAGLRFSWTCLSRVDTLDEDLLHLMKEAGCRRIYLGVESGSQRMLDAYRKNYRVSDIVRKAKGLRRSGIETAAFFMVGAPGETEEDVRQSLTLAKGAQFDYIMVFRIIPYPGTPLFEAMKDGIDFSLFPYRNELKDRAAERRCLRWETLLYRRYYFRPGYALRRAARLARHPVQALRLAGELAGFTLGRWRSRMRQDFI